MLAVAIDLCTLLSPLAGTTRFSARCLLNLGPDQQIPAAAVKRKRSTLSAATPAQSEATVNLQRAQSKDPPRASEQSFRHLQVHRIRTHHNQADRDAGL